MYKAVGNQIFHDNELFLTVHPTDCGDNMTIEKQAELIAELLNQEFGDAG